eukprot:TRINITY_DN2539_c0_g1_i1.p2 TRINITY_DN2539_c0_g1~~TRINITY_DN2539_c0_g1_i1.p2  ORF type:complete len:545 (-),score=192.73 TRINITY_DN2539_c0_g1_i1:409-2043(-)
MLVLNQNTKREQGQKAQLNNINAAKAVAEFVRTTLGPQSMLKMILDPMGGIVITNDGNAILREIDVTHPAAKHMIELSRAQDEEVGDGTTTVIVLAGEILQIAQQYVEQSIHSIKIVQGLSRALNDAVDHLDTLAIPIDLEDRQQLVKVVTACLGTKMMTREDEVMANLAIDATRTVTVVDQKSGRKEIDLKRYAKVEKVPGGEFAESRVLRGVMIEKDVVHPKMKRRIVKPRVVLLDCPLEYKKGENSINVELRDPSNIEKLLKLEEEYVRQLCDDIIKFKPDLVFTEKGLSDIAAHYLAKAGITAFRRLRKTDNNRIARVTGATIVHRTDELQESDIGTGCGLFEVRKFGDEYFLFLEECQDPKACTILLRGASKDFLNEVERNLQDAMNVTRNIFRDPRIVYGGGAIEMALSAALMERAKSITGVQQWTYQSVALALEVIPRTLLANCGSPTVNLITELRALHAKPGNTHWGVNGIKGGLADIRELGILEPLAVKAQSIKTAVESACMLLRIDDIVSGIKKEDKDKHGAKATPKEHGEEES